jgi:hypothetical protein
MLERVEERSVSIARLCSRARPDSDALGEEERSTSAEDREEKDLLGVLGDPPASTEGDLNSEDIVVFPPPASTFE